MQRSRPMLRLRRAPSQASTVPLPMMGPHSNEVAVLEALLLTTPQLFWRCQKLSAFSIWTLWRRAMPQRRAGCGLMTRLAAASHSALRRHSCC